METTRYSHTQKGWIQWIVAPIGVLLTGFGSFLEAPAAVGPLLIAVGAILVLLALCFSQLTIREQGDRLELSYGPIPLFRRTIRYGRIRSFERSRSWLIDGWGIHWVPARGWTWNLWGRDCLELELENGQVRVGTDDLDGLATHLADRVG